VTLPGLSEADWLVILQEIQRQPAIQKVILYGSRAKGTAKRGSDVDLALVGPQVNRSVLVDLSMRLNEEVPLPYRFDLVDYQTIDNVALLDHIQRVGVVVYEQEGAPKGPPTSPLAVG